MSNFARYHPIALIVAALWIATAFAFWNSGHPAAGWGFLLSFILLPIFALVGERQRVPVGRWLAIPSATLLVEVLIVVGLAAYAVSRI